MDSIIYIFIFLENSIITLITSILILFSMPMKLVDFYYIIPISSTYIYFFQERSPTAEEASIASYLLEWPSGKGRQGEIAVWIHSNLGRPI